mgnify:CR=1 FL=1
MAYGFRWRVQTPQDSMSPRESTESLFDVQRRCLENVTRYEAIYGGEDIVSAAHIPIELVLLYCVYVRVSCGVSTAVCNRRRYMCFATWLLVTWLLLIRSQCVNSVSCRTRRLWRWCKPPCWVYLWSKRMTIHLHLRSQDAWTWQSGRYVTLTVEM